LNDGGGGNWRDSRETDRMVPVDSAEVDAAG
jgi:hypothetical protein